MDWILLETHAHILKVVKCWQSLFESLKLLLWCKVCFDENWWEKCKTWIIGTIKAYLETCHNNLHPLIRSPPPMFWDRIIKVVSVQVLYPLLCTHQKELWTFCVASCYVSVLWNCFVFGFSAMETIEMMSMSMMMMMLWGKKYFCKHCFNSHIQD